MILHLAVPRESYDTKKHIDRFHLHSNKSAQHNVMHFGSPNQNINANNCALTEACNKRTIELSSSLTALSQKVFYQNMRVECLPRRLQSVFFMRMQNAFKTFCFDGNPPPSSFGSVWFVLALFGLKNVEILKKVLWFWNHKTRKTIFWWNRWFQVMRIQFSLTGVLFQNSKTLHFDSRVRKTAFSWIVGSKSWECSFH